MSPVDINDFEKFTEWLNDLEVTKNLVHYPLIISMEAEKEILVKLSKEHLYSFNEKAIKSYEKIGFKIIRKRRDALLRGKDRYDYIYMDILSDEFYENIMPQNEQLESKT